MTIPSPAREPTPEERARREAREVAKTVDRWLHRGGEDEVVAAFAVVICRAREQAREEALEAACYAIRPLFSSDELRLRAGEMTSQELRTVKAIVTLALARVEALKARP